LVLDELLKEYEGKIRVVLKHMVVHPREVMMAHLASCAAAKQGKFKEFNHSFWENGYKASREKRDAALLGEENIMKIAGELGLNVEQLKGDMQGCQAVIQADQEELQKFKVSGTPAFFINGEFVGGGIPKPAFKQIIDKKLQIAQQSGVPGRDYYEKEIRGKGEKAVVRKR
jgi:protein-disulfide isomerase